MFGKDKEAAEQKSAPQAAAASAQEARPGAAPAGDVPSIISADMKVVGNLHSNGDIQIDGTVEGDIKSRTLTVGENAHIIGSISAESVNVCGRVTGQVSATSVRIARTANVQGDINYKTLAIEEEAVLDGQIRRLDGKPAIEAKPAAADAKPASSGGDSKVETLKTAQAGGSSAGGSSSGGSSSGGSSSGGSSAGGSSSGGSSTGAAAVQAKPGGGKPLAS